MRVAFCTPTGWAAEPEHYRNKAIVSANVPEHQFVYAEVDLHVVSKARNILLTQVPEEIDVIWFVDSDILLPPHAGVLLDHISDENRVVSGLYFHRFPPYVPQVYYHASGEPSSHAYLPLVQIPTSPFKPDAVGAGCLLIRRDVLEDLAVEHEKFQQTVSKWRNTWLKRRMEAVDTYTTWAVDRAINLSLTLTAYFEFLEHVGEDFWFCEQLYAYLNERPLLVPGVSCGHVTRKVVTNADYEQTLRQGHIEYAGVTLEELEDQSRGAT